MRRSLHSFLAEPRPQHAPPPLPRDWALVAVLVAAGVLEVLLRDDLAWPGLALVAGVGPALCLPWRRTRPLPVATAVTASVVLGDAVMVLGTGELVDLSALVYVLLVPYALLRWGSGVEAAAGMAVVLVVPVFAAVAGGDLGDLALGLSSFSLLAAFGAAMRYRARSRLSEADQIRLREREQLARELHDTVAHHVSAIAIRAQAGRTLAPTQPEAGVEALEVIEEAASRTLADLRALVGALRDRDEADLAPQRGVADIARLADRPGDGPRIDVHLVGDLDGLRPLVGAAVYRIAQESVTNALRHARHATRIDVHVDGHDDAVRLTVHDDGDAVPSGADRASGYGLVGMGERAALLGGTLQAGPGAERGWTVAAVLPREGSAA